MMRRNPRAVPLLAVLLACACGPGAPERPSPGASPAPSPPPDLASASLVLVTLDTFRADAAGCGGSPGAHTPWLDRLAREGLQFETGLAASPLTAPSHASILTGRIPPAHGVRDNGTFRLPEDVPTIAEALVARGIATGAFVGAFPLLGRFGFAKGFDRYDDAVGPMLAAAAFRLAQRTGDAVASAALAWMAQVPAAARLFAWIHFFDAHAPHDSPRPWVHAARGDDYGGDVAWTDHHLGAVVRAVESGSRPAWILVQADHGESRGEHGEDTHAIFVYDATIRVPAVIWPAPEGEAPGLRRAEFRNVDVAATAFALLGFPPEEAPGGGASALAARSAPAYAESFYPYFHYGWSELRSLRDGRWKYIRSTAPELFDLQSDPGELRNVFEERRDVAERLEAQLTGIDERASAASELTESEREALESLGYATTRAAPAGDEERPDPKSMMRVQELLYDAMRAMSAGHYEDARRPLSAALSRDPRNKEVHKILGMLHAATGQDDRAIDSFRRALELPPHADDEASRLELAAAYFRRSRFEEAAREYEIVTEVDSTTPDIWFNLGSSRMAGGDRERAVRAWRRALAVDPQHESARDQLLRIGERP